MDEAIDELRAEASFDAPVVFHPSWPWIGVSLEGGGHVIFIRGNERGPEARFNISRPAHFMLTGSTISCRYKKNGKNRFILHSTRPEDATRIARKYPAEVGVWTLETKHGRLAGGSIHPPETTNPDWSGNYLSDGINYWRATAEGVTRVDPVSGKSLDKRVPEIVEALLDGDSVCDPAEMYWIPETEFSRGSGLASRDGIHGWIPLRSGRQYSYVLPDGGSITTTRKISAALTHPGGTTHYLSSEGLLRAIFMTISCERCHKLRPATVRAIGCSHFPHQHLPT